MRPRRRNYWAVEAEKILAPLFAEGQEPTWVELRDAYPFGERKYWPYKVWLDAIYRWQNPTAPPQRRRPLAIPPEQVRLIPEADDAEKPCQRRRA